MFLKFKQLLFNYKYLIYNSPTCSSRFFSALTRHKRFTSRLAKGVSYVMKNFSPIVDEIENKIGNLPLFALFLDRKFSTSFSTSYNNRILIYRNYFYMRKFLYDLLLCSSRIISYWVEFAHKQYNTISATTRMYSKD